LVRNPLIFKNENDCIVVANRKLNSDGYFRIHRRDGLHMYHRVVYEHFKGKVPAGYEIHHSCRNRACSNIDHLELIEISDHKTLTNNEREFKIGEWAKEGNKKNVGRNDTTTQDVFSNDYHGSTHGRNSERSRT